MRNITFILIILFSSLGFAQEKRTNPKFQEFQSVRLEVNAGSSSIESLNKSTGNKQSLDASKNITFDLKVLHHWSESSRSYLGLDYNDLAYKTTSGRINSGNLISAKIGHIINPIPRLSLSGELLAYSHVLATSDLDLTAETNIAAQVSYQLDVYHASKTRLGFGQSLLVAPTAFEYKVGIYGRKIYERFSVELDFNYEGGVWENSSTRTTFDNYLVGTKISIPFL